MRWYYLVCGSTRYHRLSFHPTDSFDHIRRQPLRLLKARESFTIQSEPVNKRSKFIEGIDVD